MTSPQPSPSRLVRPVVVVLFLCSGASGLVFETLWMRLLTTTFGATTFAISTLLTVFMGGLALGGWLAGTIADRLRRESTALIVYGALELIVAAYGLAFPAILDQVHELHGWIWAQYSPGPYAFALIRFLVVGVVLIVPTTAMGATLPVLSRFYARREHGLGRDVGILYSVNIFGAVSGTFLAGFVLMPALGLAATNRFACSVNLLLCVAAAGLGAWLRQREGDQGSLPAESTSPERGPAGIRTWGRDPWVALVAVAVSGLMAMVYQQVWTRVLAQVVGSSVYAFALILMAFLLGLALGGAFYARWLAHRPGQMGRLGLVHLLIAVMVLLGFFYMDRLPQLFLALARRTDVSPGSIFLLQFLVCSLVVVLPTFFMGMLFPATISVCAEGMSGVARTVGRVYAINTFGSIIGSFLGGFVMLPFVGSQLSLAIMIVLNLLLAMVFTGLSPLPRRSRMIRAGVMGALLMGTLAGAGAPWAPSRMTAGVFRLALHMRGTEADTCPSEGDPVSRLFAKGVGQQQVRWAEERLGHRPDLDVPCRAVVGRKLIHYQEGLVATVSTWQTITEGLEPTTCWEILALQVNGKVDASATGAFRKPRQEPCGDYLGRPGRIRPSRISGEGDMETQVLSGLLGMLLYPSEERPRQALVVGWGSGISVGVLARTGIQRVDAVELEPEVLRGARFFERYNQQAASAKNVHILQADGRNVLVARSDSFDLIVSEPSNPWMTGAASLFTQEYFRLVRRRLHAKGLFIQWLQVYEISLENVRSVIATLRSVFPHVTVFRSRQAEVDLLLVASRTPLRLDGRRLQERLAWPEAKGPLARVGIHTLGDLLVRHMVPPAQVDALVKGAPLNTDDNARIEFSAPKDLINFRKHSPDRILARLQRGVPPVSGLISRPPATLPAELVDAELRLGKRRAAQRLLARVSTGQARQRRAQLIGWLRDAPPWKTAVAEALKALPGGENLAARWEAGAPDALRLSTLERAVAGPMDFVRARALGALLAGTRHQGLALLFLTAGLAEGPPSPGLERVRVWLLWRQGLHALAVERAHATWQ